MAISGNAPRVLRRFVNTTVPSKVEATARQIAQYSLDTAIRLSPYDTGWFMASWRVTKTPTEVAPATQGKRSSPQSAAAESEALSASVIRSIRFGDSFYIQNNAPHAQYVEFGSPTSAAHYITRRTAQAVGGRFGKIK